MAGWIKIDREIPKHWIWKESDHFKWWIDILIMASFGTEKIKLDGRRFEIRRGQLITSIKELSLRWKINRSTAWRFLKKLEADGMLDLKTEDGAYLISICNYDRYQGEENEKTLQQYAQQPTQQYMQQSSQHLTSGEIDSYEGVRTDGATGAATCSATGDATIPYIRIEEYKNINNTTQSWRYLSSVQRSICGFDKDKMAEMKRDIFRKEVEAIVPQIGMPPDQVEAFIRYYTEHTPGNDRIRAENYDPFNVQDRMISWMERERPKGAAARQVQQPKSKLQQTIESRNEFQQWVNEQFGNTAAGFGGPAAPGYSDADYQSGE